MVEQHEPTRQERRDERKRAERERLAKHGAGLRQVYINAVLKRLRPRGKSTKRS